MKKTIIWLRNDIRLSDNEAINYAYKNNSELLFLYIWDKSTSIGSASKWFLHNSLQAFQQSIKQKYNADLIIKRGASREILAEIAKKYSINSVVWNRIWEPKEMKKEAEIKEFFSTNNIEAKSFNSSLLFQPSKIKNLSGDYFKVFTPFWKKCLSEIANIAPPCEMPKSLNLIKIQQGETLTLEQLNLLPNNPNWAKNWDNLYKISEEDAGNIAHDFMKNKMADYKDARNFPAGHNTSVLSPYLHFGLISPRQLYFQSLQFEQNKGSAHFLSEIGWREFSYYLLYHFPDLPSRNFRPEFDNFPWQNNEVYLEKWQRAETGFPLIDASMRQLWQTGWMHNRTRMVVASFLTKNLLIDWRIGQEWFWDCLVDADLAANSASWQWVAGSGADAAPYFRIFNPILQSKKFDPKGEYIRKWMPEIRHLPDSEIHNPVNRRGYAEPVIELDVSRNKALEIYQTMKQATK